MGLDLSWSLMIFNGPHLSWAHLQRSGALFMCPESLLKCHRVLLICHEGVCHEGVMRDFSWMGGCVHVSVCIWMGGCVHVSVCTS